MLTTQQEISAAAEKTLCKFDDYPKQAPAKRKATITATCTSCNKQYNFTFTQSVLEKIKAIKDFNYNLCLDCIKSASRSSKAIAYQELKESRAILDKIQLQYYNAHKQYKADKRTYESLDYQEAIIAHQQKLKAQPKKPTTKKKSPKKSADAATIALKALANLTPAQQQAILANLAKQ